MKITCIRVSTNSGCVSLKARKKSRVRGAVGFGFYFSLVEKLARDF